MKDSKMTIQEGTDQAKAGIYAEVELNGPIILHGGTPILQHFIVHDGNGTSINYQEGTEFKASDPVSLCRCGLSENKPYCDGSHVNAKASGVALTETATFESELNSAQKIVGPERTLSDDEKLCAFARFCDAGERVWNEVKREGEASKKLTLEIAHHCPGGRLIVWENSSQQPIETKEEPSVGLIEDVKLKCSGGIMLRGGIPVKSASGEFYEVRNRQTLCRCGKSFNKPFCDGSHASWKFEDGLPGNPKKDGKVW